LVRIVRCNECKIRKILFELWVTEVPRHVNYRTLEVRCLSAQQFDTLCGMLEETFFLHTLISLYNAALEGNCPHSQNLSLRGDWLRARSEQEEEQSSYYVFKDSLAFVCPT